MGCQGGVKGKRGIVVISPPILELGEKVRRQEVCAALPERA